MKVEKVIPFSGETVSFEGEEHEFTRYSSDCWYERFGDTEIPCYPRDSELEAAYQEWLKS